MKLVWIGIAGAGAILLFCAVPFFRSRAVHVQYHECRNHRNELDTARYWYALDSGMTNAPGLLKEALLPYVENQAALACPRGGSYSVDPKSLLVACNIPEHMFDNCYGNPASTHEPDSWPRSYPLDYRSSDTWRYITANTKKGTIFRMSGATIEFKDLHDWRWIDKVQDMKVSGPGTYHCSFEFEDKVVTESYEAEVHTFNIAGHIVHISGHGRSLQIDTNVFDLSGSRPRIVVEADRGAHIEVIREGSEPGGAANGSQPIRSVTNTTSSAAGSRR